jgi:hypothetical protein
MIAQKHKVRITLDIECYDDLNLNLNWEKILGLEGGETVDVDIKEDSKLRW